MFGKSQGQVVAANSTALQAARDINVHGLSLADVETAFKFFFENNFPRLQEEARIQAEKYVRQFAETLARDLDSSAQNVLIAKFGDPDVQAAMVDAVNACARKGSAANTNVLSGLIVQRMAAANSSFLDIVLSEAVTVVPKLTGEQIGFLALVHSRNNVRVEVPTWNSLQTLAMMALPTVRLGAKLGESQKLHLIYAGAMSRKPIRLHADDPFAAPYSELRSHFAAAELKDFKSQALSEAPAYCELMGLWHEAAGSDFDLTSVGIAIACAVLAPGFKGSMDYSIWLN
ncbi:LPO_1073/Vpar_1526 family protein [Variovorax sp. 375MFSha3.1]|uniref:LPO_1073/Vpar_1526 family protein n=1 Tax=Variovorax sp. 375MFSha3.1 TaxID=3158364 RepID=UPI003AAF8484